MTEYQDKYIDIDGMRFHYLEWGDPSAPPVVMLHGTTSNAHSWDKVSAVLAKRYRVLALDCRDHGESDSTTAPIEANQLSNDVGATVDKLGIDKFGLIGLSMGGRTAMTYTGYNPDRVERLVIEDIGPEVPPEAQARVRATISASGTTDFASPDEYVEFQRTNKQHAPREWLSHLAEHSLKQLPNGRWVNKYRPRKEGMMMPGGPDLWEHITNITCPTLIIRGGESDILDEDITNRMLERMPNAKAVAIPKAAHVVHEDNPTETIAAIADFFDVPVS
jgi:pimeloyl-ACP methyl ester carboxylesterase